MNIMSEEEKKETVKEKASRLGGVLSNLEKQMSVLHSTHEKKLDVLYAIKEKEINELLPKAGVASLTSGYAESKRYFGGFFKALFNYILFLTPLVFSFFYIVYDFEKNKYLTFSNLGELQVDEVIIKIILFSPLLLISYFGFSSIRFNRRMYEEYNHKKRIMQLYRSFSEEVQDHNFNNERRQLIGNMLETVSDNPGRVISNYDSPGFLEVIKSIWNK